MPLPALLLGGSKISGLLSGIGGIVGIKGSYTIKTNFSGADYRGFFDEVKLFKIENGIVRFPYDNDEPRYIYRYLTGDFPAPDRDEKDRNNRERMIRLTNELQGLASLPINSLLASPSVGKVDLPDVRGVAPPQGKVPSFTLDGPAVSGSVGGFPIMYLLLAGVGTAIFLAAKK